MLRAVSVRALEAAFADLIRRLAADVELVDLRQCAVDRVREGRHAVAAVAGVQGLVGEG